MTVHVYYSKPSGGDKAGVTHNADGHISIDTLKRILPFADYDFYLCGPFGFMNSLYSGLIGLSVPPARIHFESFGWGTVLKPEILKGAVQQVAGEETSPARVRFAKSAIDATWSPAKGTLLEFAEEVGLTPPFGCRSGICGTCRTRIVSGAVRYVEEPLASIDQGEILICCSVPRDPDVTLDI